MDAKQIRCYEIKYDRCDVPIGVIRPEMVSNLKQVPTHRRTLSNPLLPDCSSVRISYCVCSVSYELRSIAIPISFWFTCEFTCFTVVCVGVVYYFTYKSIMYEMENVTLATSRISFNILVNDPFDYSEDQRYFPIGSAWDKLTTRKEGDNIVRFMFNCEQLLEISERNNNARTCRRCGLSIT